MDDRYPEELEHLLAVCTSCRQLHPDGYTCACLVERAAVVAELLHDLRRAGLPRWRRPRSWDALPERVRQDFTLAALTLVDALEGSGWRLVTDRALSRHVLPEAPAVFDDATRTTAVVSPFAADPDAVTPPSGEFRVPNVVR